jgi:hypothetical protein
VDTETSARVASRDVLADRSLRLACLTYGDDTGDSSAGPDTATRTLFRL